MIAKRFIVRGRVQGVGFRWFVQHEAQALGLTGWVRNTFEGAVEVLACGSAQQLEALRGKLERGPRAARVDSVDAQEAQASEQEQKVFRIEGAW